MSDTSAPDIAPRFILLDANAYRDSNVLYGTLGTKFLATLVTLKAKLILPDIVEREVAAMMRKKVRTACQRIAAEANVIDALSQYGLVKRPSFTDEQIQKAVERRFSEFNGFCIGEEFSFEIAKAALERIFAKRAPCGDDNEQFRDSCIWEICLKYASIGPTAFITRDGDFLEKVNQVGLHPSLKEELNSTSYVEHFLGIEEFVKKYDKAAGSNEPELVRSLTAALPIALDIGLQPRGVRVNSITSIDVERHEVEGALSLALFEVKAAITTDESMPESYDLAVFIGSCSVTLPSFEISDILIDRTTLVGRNKHHEIYHFANAGDEELSTLEQARDVLMAAFRKLSS